MSDILASMTTYLLTCSDLTGLIGTRLSPAPLPSGSTSSPNVMPSVTYQLIDEPVQITHDEQSTFRARVQFDVWAGTYKSAHAVADALFGALHGFRGSWAPYRIGYIFRVRKSDDPASSDVGLAHLSQDFEIGYAEP